jgi:DNA-binding beta-propeller fold protein YncE
MKAYPRPLALAASIAGFLVLASLSLSRAESSKPLELVQTIPLKGKAGRLDHLSLDGKGRRLFVANLSNDSLDIVDLKEGKLLKQIVGQGKIQGVAYAPDLDRIFVGNGADGVCNAFDGKDYSPLKSFKLPNADNVRYDPMSARVYVSHAEHSLAVLDAKALKLLATVKLPGPPEAFQLDLAKPRIFVNCLSPAQVVVIDTTKQEVVTSYPLEGAKANYPLALDTDRHRVFVGCRKPPAVLALDAETGKEVARIDIPGDIDDLFYDAKRKRLYATCGEGFLAVIEQKDAYRFKLIEKLATARQVRTGLFDPETDRFYLVLPARDRKGPEVQVYQAKP